MLVALLIGAAAALAVALLVLDLDGRRSANWGASRAEVAAAMTGDDWLAGGPPVRLRMTRAVTIAAPPEAVWPWIAQLGRGAGWYSYDRLDNGGRPSARHIVTWIPEPRLGDATTIGYLRHLEPGRELGWWLPGLRYLGAWFRGVVIFRLQGAGEGCRLVVRFQADAAGRLARPACRLFRAIDGIMARRQLMCIRHRVESYGARRQEPQCPESGARDQYQLYQAIYASGKEAGVPGKEDAWRWRQAALAHGVIEAAVA